MRYFLRSVIVTSLVFGILVVFGFVVLAAWRPLKPGSPIFIPQYIAEQTSALLIRDAGERALYYVELAEQRGYDLSSRVGGNHELIAARYLDAALDQVLGAVDIDKMDNEVVINSRLADLVNQTETVLRLLKRAPQDYADTYAAIQTKVQALRALAKNNRATPREFDRPSGMTLMLPLVTGESLDDKLLSQAGLTNPQGVAFLPGSPGAVHDFFPLVGVHAALECESCHFNGQYAGTLDWCEACHIGDKPPNHFAGDCTACHNAYSWADVNLDHILAEASDCQACHLDDRPVNHYTAQCSLCHLTTTWSSATFNHQAIGATDCQTCHLRDKPANHFEGQCSQCHDTSAWRNATFNHQAVGATDCAACHLDERPANHFEGQCSQCHDTSAWRNATFNHQAVGATDCAAC
ncbi:MAG: hypothetical protein JJE12_11865, partial [Anaerolineales bacterium]|nr:hypothetical protein [Anaerolineales bacterium]